MYGGIDAFNAQMTEQKRSLTLSEVQELLDEPTAGWSNISPACLMSNSPQKRASAAGCDWTPTAITGSYPGDPRLVPAVSLK